MRVDLSVSPTSVDYSRALGAPVAFDAPHNAIVTDSAVLDLPLPQAESLTMTACERACRSLLLERCSQCVAQKVRTIIAEGVTDADLIAARLHLSSRTLRRHLAAESTSLRHLVDEASTAGPSNSWRCAG